MLQHTSAYVRIREYTSCRYLCAYPLAARIRQHTSCIRQRILLALAYVSIRLAYVSIHLVITYTHILFAIAHKRQQHTSAYVSIRQHTSRYLYAYPLRARA